MKHASLRELGERPGDQPGLSLSVPHSKGGDDDGYGEWMEEVVALSARVFYGCFDETILVDEDMWQAFCDGVPPVYYMLDFILPELVSEFSEELILDTVARNLMWGRYQ